MANAYFIDAMNVETGITKTHLVEADSTDHAIQRLESDEYITPEAPYGWEVMHYSYPDWCE